MHPQPPGAQGIREIITQGRASAQDCRLDAERAVLGAAVQSAESATAVVAALATRHFAAAAHRAIFPAIAVLVARGSHVDLLTVAEELRRAGHLEAAGGVYGLQKLLDDSVGAAGLRTYISTVRRFAQLEQLAARADAIGEAAREARLDSGAILARAQDESDPLVRAVWSAVGDSLDAGRGTGGPSGIAFRTPAEIAAESGRDVRWLLPGSIAQGDIVVCAGAAGSGKSTLSAQFAVAIATGAPFLGVTPTRTGAVLVIDEEQRADTVARLYYRAAGGREVDGLRIASRVGVRLSDPAWTNALERAVEDHTPAAVVIDSMAATFGCDLMSAAEVAPIYDGLKRIRDRLGVTLWIIAHSPKGQVGFARRDIDEIFGSQVHAASIDVGLVLKRSTDGAFVLRTAKNRNAEEGVTRFSMTWSEDAITAAPAAPAEEAKGEQAASQAILDLLSDRGEAQWNEMVQAAVASGAGSRSAATAIGGLVGARKIVQRRKRGPYRLSEMDSQGVFLP